MFPKLFPRVAPSKNVPWTKLLPTKSVKLKRANKTDNSGDHLYQEIATENDENEDLILDGDKYVNSEGDLSFFNYRTSECNGVKLCRHSVSTDEGLAAFLSHSHNSWNYSHDVESEATNMESLMSKAAKMTKQDDKTRHWYGAFMKKWLQEGGCSVIRVNVRCNGNPILVEFKNVNPSFFLHLANTKVSLTRKNMFTSTLLAAVTINFRKSTI